MECKTPNGKVVSVPDKEIECLMNLLHLSQEEAVHTWLCDNDYIMDEEQEELNSRAKKVKIQLGAKDISKKREQKPRTIKISDEKHELFSKIRDFLTENFQNVEILKENKLFAVKINEKVFKIDLIEQRAKKESDK